MSRCRRILASCFLPAVLSVLLSACAGDASDGDRSYRTPELESVPVVESSLTVPFQQYELSFAERQRMQVGHARLLERCMSERGFSVAVAGDFVLGHQRDGVMDPAMWGGPFGTMPLEHARRYGYKPEKDGPFVKGPGFYLSNPGHLFLETGKITEDQLAPAERAYYGADGDPGCVDRVEEQIGVTLVDFIDLRSDVSQLAREHPRVESAMRAWVECMAQSGYRYSQVWEASQRYGTAPVSQVQVETAVADVRCTRQSHWADYFYAAVADYQRQAIERTPDLLEGALESEKARLLAIEAELARAR